MLSRFFSYQPSDRNSLGFRLIIIFCLISELFDNWSHWLYLFDQLPYPKSWLKYIFIKELASLYLIIRYCKPLKIIPYYQEIVVFHFLTHILSAPANIFGEGPDQVISGDLITKFLIGSFVAFDCLIHFTNLYRISSEINRVKTVNQN